MSVDQGAKRRSKKHGNRTGGGSTEKKTKARTSGPSPELCVFDGSDPAAKGRTTSSSNSSWGMKTPVRIYAAEAQDYFMDVSDEEDSCDEMQIQQLYKLARSNTTSNRVNHGIAPAGRGREADEIENMDEETLRRKYRQQRAELEKIDAVFQNVTPCSVEQAYLQHSGGIKKRLLFEASTLKNQRVIVDQRTVYLSKRRGRSDRRSNYRNSTPLPGTPPADRPMRKFIDLVARKSGRRRVRPILPIREFQIGMYTIKNIPLDIEIVRDDKTPHFLFTLSYPVDMGAKQYSKAFRPAIATMVVIVMTWFLLSVLYSIWWCFLFPLIVYFVYKIFQQNSPFAPTEGIAQFRCNISDITGWSHSSLLTQMASVALEAKVLTRTWRKSSDVPIPNTPKLRKEAVTPPASDMKGDKKGISRVRSSDSIDRAHEYRGTELRQRKGSHVVKGSGMTPISRVQSMDDFSSARRQRRTSSKFDLTKGGKECNTDKIENVVLQFRYKEPLLHPLLQDFIACHESLIPLVEDGLPSWSLFLAGYGLYYRPWMRRTMDVIIWFASVGMMLLALYDLFQNVPLVRAFVRKYLGKWFSFIENILGAFRVFFVGIIFPINPIIGLFRGLSNAVYISLKVPLQFAFAILKGMGGFCRGMCSCCKAFRPDTAIRMVKTGSQISKSATSGGITAPIKAFITMCQWIWRIFRSIFLVGLAKIGTYLTSHTQTIYRLYILKHRDRLLAIFLGIVLAIVVLAIVV